MTSQDTPIWTRSFIAVFTAGLLVFMAFYLLIPTLPLYLTEHLGASRKDTGIALALYTIAAVLVRPATGSLLDHYGRKWPYLISLLIFSLLFGGYLVSGTLAAIMILRLIHGVLWGIFTTSSNTVAVDLVPVHKRGEGLSYFGLSSTIPMALGPLIGLSLVNDGNYDRMFVVSILLGLTGFIIASRIRFPKIEIKTSRFSLRNLIENTSLPVSLIMMINMISYGGLVTFVSIYVKENKQGDAGLFFLVYASGIALSRLFSGKVFDTHGPKRLMLNAFGLLIAGFLLLALFRTHFGLLVSALFLGMGSGMIFPVMQTMTNNMVEAHRRGAANSTLFTALDLGIGIGMILTGYLSGLIGLVNTYLLFSLVNGLALLLFLVFAFPHYQKHIKNVNQAVNL